MTVGESACTPLPGRDTTYPRRQSIGAYQWTIAISIGTRDDYQLSVVICPRAHQHTSRNVTQHVSAHHRSEARCVTVLFEIQGPVPRLRSNPSRIPISRSFTRPTERRLKTCSWLNSHCNLRRSRPRPIHSPRPTQPSSTRQTRYVHFCCPCICCYRLSHVGFPNSRGTSPNGRLRPAAFSHYPGTVLDGGWRMCVIADGWAAWKATVASRGEVAKVKTSSAHILDNGSPVVEGP